ncbi:unnamed protein product [Ambrosiozyma monospora]|uniref:Unnamed protein product n=2 Tax=Ambrosiozyma monospora TaxID=43982 RepID=A0ACB5U578_AMBMO|nr:unnamed protein product [Ambrosiozyma monospora]
MGINSIRLPSRNWMIFWISLATLSGGIVYDKWQQKQLRKKYIELAKPVGDQPFEVNQLPRKLRIYVVPPPNDYLNESFKYLRRFVKPILNSAGLDFDIFTETRQGDIRSTVAEEIRRLRRAKLGLPDKRPEDLAKEQAEAEAQKVNESAQGEEKKKWLAPVSFTEVKKPEVDDKEEETKALKDLYNPNDVLGITHFMKKNDLQKPFIKEDQVVSKAQDAGGVICLGRGAFKEYVNGIHEGLLGPLYEPEKPPVEQKLQELDAETGKEKEPEPNANDEDEDEEKKMDPVPDPYITPKEYRNAELAPELDLVNGRDSNGIPYFFLQPIAVLRNYNTAGFTKQPERIWRFYHKRDQLIDYNETLWGLIKKNYRPFTKDDLQLAAEEEHDWPNKWVQTSLDKNSEWVRDFSGDERVFGVLSVYQKVERDEDQNKEVVNEVKN